MKRATRRIKVSNVYQTKRYTVLLPLTAGLRMGVENISIEHHAVETTREKSEENKLFNYAGSIVEDQQTEGRGDDDHSNPHIR